MQLKELPTLKVSPGFAGISKRSRFYTTVCGWCYGQLQVGATGQTCDLHLRFLLDFIGACRFRIYTTLGSYGVSQANTGAGSTIQFPDLHFRFHRQIQVQDLQCSFKIYTSGFSRSRRHHYRFRNYTSDRQEFYKHLQDRADRVKTKKKEQQQEN